MQSREEKKQFGLFVMGWVGLRGWKREEEERGRRGRLRREEAARGEGKGDESGDHGRKAAWAKR